METWLPVVGHEGFYEVSDHGRVRSVDRVVPSTGVRKSIRLKGRILKHGTRYGYNFIAICRNGVAETPCIHKLVAMAFIGVPEIKSLCVNHKNGIRNDNRPDNLEWVTLAENNWHARNVLGTSVRGESVWASIMTESDVRKAREWVSLGATSISVAVWFGVHRGTICDLVARRTWKHVK